MVQKKKQSNQFYSLIMYYRGSITEKGGVRYLLPLIVKNCIGHYLLI